MGLGYYCASSEGMGHFRMVIWKYPIEVTGIQDIDMPQGAQILSVQIQVMRPVLWVLVNDKDQKFLRRIVTVATGELFPESLTGRFIGTYQLHDGELVFHVFER